MKQSLNLKLSQQLTLTPQLKQSLKLLQLPSLDLEQEVQQILESNPLLERVAQEQTEDREIQAHEPAQDNGVPQPVSEAVDPNYELERTDHLAPEQDLSVNWQESFEPNRAALSTSSAASDESGEFTQYVVKQETLFEHLDWQIQMTRLSEKDKLIAHTILHCLDSDGYLNSGTIEICQMLSGAEQTGAGQPGAEQKNRLEDEVELDEVEAMLSLIKSLEPTGVGARDLSERLQILLESRHGDTELALAIVKDHIDLLGAHNLAKLKKELHVDDERLFEALSMITELNPRIGSQFQSDNENYVIPDVHVKKVSGHWLAKLNPENQTKLRVNETYADLLKSDAQQLEKGASDYIQHNLQEAKIFIKGLMSRYDTLLLVAEAIVERQQSFFENGDQGMQPMVLQDIAEALDMHESTISRATSGKYLLSPRGVYELKFFFSSALSSTDGTVSSSTAIRSLIKNMVEAENKAKPLSDSKIAKELEQQGHIVARRTVAKYRESMHIAPSSQRKALVKLAG